MNKDSLGDRMKTYYENRYRFYLTRRTPCIIRIDGNSFHSFTRGFAKPYDMVLKQSMWETAEYLCSHIMGAKFAYVQSDEISILVLDYSSKLTTEAWFDYNIQKMASISAGMATMAFNAAFRKYVVNEKLSSNYIADTAVYMKKLNTAFFDARVFNLPEHEVVNYFIWRQQDAERNSVNMYGRQFMSQSEMHSKNSKEIRRLLEEKYHNPWENNSTFFKRGVCIQKVQYEEFFKAPNGNTGTVRRNRWDVNLEIPIFTQDKEFISNYLIIEEQN